MPPAFSSTRQAAAFVALLVFLLAAPWLSARHILPAPNETYSSESIRLERFPWMQKFIFEETNDIDIAFVGSSRMGYGIYTPCVQQKLDERLGRKTVVRSICWQGGGFDGLYFFTKDLLAHRHVKTLVFCDECASDKAKNPQQFLSSWFDFAGDGAMIRDLPPADQAVYYFAAVIRLPRFLLASIDSGLPRYFQGARLSPFLENGISLDPEENLGCLTIHQNYSPVTQSSTTNYSRFVPPTTATSSNVCLYDSKSPANFEFSNRPLADLQIYFARQFGLLAVQHGCQLVALHIPSFNERAFPVINESRNWSDLMDAKVSMIGIPPSQLYAGLSDEQIARLYFGPPHMNENGQKFFTPLVTPALVQLYENKFGR